MLSEDDAYALIQRHGASKIFTLLQEISQATEKDVTIDWRTLVKTTSTGISSAREYQMLWRHLAYRDPFENIEDGGEPLSDDSDLECELETISNLSNEALSEVDCCVKALLYSGAVGDCGPFVASTVEAPPTTCTPNDQASTAPPDKQHLNRYNRFANGAASLSQNQKMSNGAFIDRIDGNGSLNSVFPAKKKRKLWSKEEDMELIAAVKKFGEGNWANILKGDFKHDRTASQLSQRWAIIRKRQTSSNQSTGGYKSKSEEMLAAQKAFSMALNMPMSGGLSTINSGGTQMQRVNSSPAMAGGTASLIDESQATTSQIFKQNPLPANQEPSSPKRVLSISNKSKSSQKKHQAQAKSSICPNPLIKAAAFAAGGRIATPSTAASLFKAAQSKNVVRIRHGGATITGASASSSTNTTISSSSSAKTTPATTAIVGLHAVNPRFTQPSTSKLCHTQGASGTPCPPQSTSMNHLQSESKMARTSTSCGIQPNGKRRRDIIISAVDVDELLAEEARGAQGNGASDAQIAEVGASSRAHGRELNESQCSENAFMQSQEQASEAMEGGMG